MLGFDMDRFLRTEGGAVALGAEIDAVVGHCLDRGAQNVFFLGTGGAAILMQPATLLLQHRSSFPAYTAIAAELVIGGHQALGKGSLVVIPSVSGTTKESIAALEFCRAKGARIITLVGNRETPLGQMADHTLVNPAEDDTAPESLYLQSLLVALAIMARRGEWPDHGRTVAEISAVPKHLVAAKQFFEPEAKRLAQALAGESYHIITSAGGGFAPAWYVSMCILEEMQWLKTRPVHAADFFHGAFELIEKGVSVIVLKGEDQFRPLSQRVENFARQYTDKLTVIDAAAFELPGISPETRALISPVLLATALERFVTHLAAARNHPLGTRRYYKKVTY